MASLELIVLTIVVFVIDVVLFAEFSWLEERVRRTRAPLATNGVQKASSFDFEVQRISAAAQAPREDDDFSGGFALNGRSDEVNREVAILHGQVNELRAELSEARSGFGDAGLKRIEGQLEDLSKSRSNDLVEVSALKTEVEALKHGLRGLYVKELGEGAYMQSIAEIEKHVEKLSRAAKKDSKKAR